MKFKLLVLLSLLVIANLANAQIANKAKPKYMHIFPHEGVFVFTSTVNEGKKPDCAGEDRWAIKLSAAGAKEVISLVKAAKIHGRTLTVVGNDKCDDSGYGYFIDHLYLN